MAQICIFYNKDNIQKQEVTLIVHNYKEGL